MSAHARIRVSSILLIPIALLLAVSTAGAYFTSVLQNLNEPKLMGPGGILDTLYGWSNLTRLTDGGGPGPNGPGGDQTWFNPNGHARAQAKWAVYDQDFGFFNHPPFDPSLDSSFHGIFAVTGNGYNPTITGLNEWAGQNGGWYFFDHALTGVFFRYGNDPGLNVPGNPPAWSSRQTSNGLTEDHLVTWQITGNSHYPTNQIGNYVVAWEDLRFAVSDRDYNDLVVELSGVHPAPEPASVALLGLGLASAGFVFRRRKIDKK